MEAALVGVLTPLSGGLGADVEVGVDAALSALTALIAAGDKACCCRWSAGSSGFLGEDAAWIFRGGRSAPAALEDMTEAISGRRWPVWSVLVCLCPICSLPLSGVGCCCRSPTHTCGIIFAQTKRPQYFERGELIVCTAVVFSTRPQASMIAVEAAGQA